MSFPSWRPAMLGRTGGFDQKRSASRQHLSPEVSMKLVDILDSLESLSDDHCIFVYKPWTLQSFATVGPLTSGSRVPQMMANAGFHYFLEITLAKELLSDFADRLTNLQKRRDLILHYAKYDAYPDWLFD
jgi:hypothetical protein